MFFTDPAHRHPFAVAVGDGDAKDSLGQEDPLAVVPQSPVPQVGQALLRLIEKLVNGQVILGLSAPALDAGQGMMKGMTIPVRVVKYYSSSWSMSSPSSSTLRQ